MVVTVLVFCDCNATLKFGLLVECASWPAVDVVSVCLVFVRQSLHQCGILLSVTYLLLVHAAAIARVVLVIDGQVLETSLYRARRHDQCRIDSRQ